MGKTVGKKICQNLRSKYSLKFLDQTNTLVQMHLKLFQIAEKNPAEATGDLIGNKIADRNTKVSRTSPKNNSQTNEEEILRERFVAPELRHKIVNDIRIKGKKIFKTSCVDLRVI